jgi:catechol 2,3-dioxygenase-like lactoylglutathione lyase family enzyme
MFSHVFIGVGDVERALAFYRPILGALGLEARFCDPNRPWAGWQTPGQARPLFLIGAPFDGQPHATRTATSCAWCATTRQRDSQPSRVSLS